MNTSSRGMIYRRLCSLFYCLCTGLSTRSVDNIFAFFADVIFESIKPVGHEGIAISLALLHKLIVTKGFFH